MSFRLVFLLVLASLFMAFPQVPHSISGRVVDTGGFSLPGIEVILEQSNSESRKSTTTDKDGMYNFDCLMGGLYNLTFKCPGFITERMENFTYKVYSSLVLNKVLQIDPAVGDVLVAIPSDEPGKSLIVTVRDNQSSNNLENAQVVISSADGILKKSITTSLCGIASIRLEPGKKYSMRISKYGFQAQVTNFDMSDESKKLEVRLDPVK